MSFCQQTERHAEKSYQRTSAGLTALRHLLSLATAIYYQIYMSLSSVIFAKIKELLFMIPLRGKSYKQLQLNAFITPDTITVRKKSGIAIVKNKGGLNDA